MAENNEKKVYVFEPSVLDGFNDPFMKTDFGRGVFLAGVLLGKVAWEQSKKRSAGSNEKGSESSEDKNKDMKYGVESSPLFKQINFGVMTTRDLKRLLAKVPQVVRNYRIEAGLINRLLSEVNNLLLRENKEMGVEGNFAFTSGFVNANNYFWKIFKEKEVSENGV